MPTAARELKAGCFYRVKYRGLWHVAERIDAICFGCVWTVVHCNDWPKEVRELLRDTDIEDVGELVDAKIRAIVIKNEV